MGVKKPSQADNPIWPTDIFLQELHHIGPSGDVFGWGVVPASLRLQGKSGSQVARPLEGEWMDDQPPFTLPVAPGMAATSSIAATMLSAGEFESGKRELRVRVEGQLIFNTTLQILSAALAGLGLAYVPEGLVERYLAKGRLRRVTSFL